MSYKSTFLNNIQGAMGSAYRVLFLNQSDDSDDDDDDNRTEEENEDFVDEKEELFKMKRKNKGKTTSRQTTFDYNNDGEEEENPRVSNLQTCWNIFNANQGVVILTMPFVVLCGGYLSLIATCIVAAVSNYTSKKLIKCLYEEDPETGIDVRIRESYEEIGDAFAGDFGKWMVYIAMTIEQLSYCTLLLILCGNILHSSFPSAHVNNIHWSLFAFLLVMPTAFMMNLGQVAWVSLTTVVVGQIVYFILAIYSFYQASQWSFHQPPPWDIGKFFVAMGIVVVSYSSQPYMPAIEGSMRNRKRYGVVMNITYFGITAVKITFGLIGYLTYRGDTKQVITNNLPHGTLKHVVNILVLVLALASFTFPAYTVFVIIDKCNLQQQSEWIRRQYHRLIGTEANIPEEQLNQETTNLMEEENGAKGKPGLVDDKPSRAKRAVIRLTLISVALTVAVLVPHFGFYMALVGSFTGMCLSFIFPCLFHMKIRHNDMRKHELFIDTAIIAFGSVSAGVGMYYSTKALVDAYSDGKE